jgi:hypothetical protein
VETREGCIYVAEVVVPIRRILLRMKKLDE